MTNEEAKKAEKELNALLNMCNPSPLTKELEDALKLAIKALEQQPSDDTEVIKVSKGIVKARQGRFVIYDVDWLKKNFYSTEEKIYGQPKQPCEDCISRQAVDDAIYDYSRSCDVNYEQIMEFIDKLPSVTPRRDLAETSQDCISREEMLKYQQYLHGKMPNEENHKLWNFIKGLPSIKPKYTDEEIDKAQEIEQAYVDKMVELAVEESRKKWLNSFDTNSATECFTAVNLLKQRLEGDT